MSRSASVVEAGANGGADAVGDRRHLALHCLELTPEHDDAAHRRRGHDFRGPPRGLQQADLAEEIAWAELRDRLAVVRDLGRAFLDHEELVRELPFRREPLALTDRDLVGPLREPLQLLLRET